jgi:hypothetical protein
MYSFIALAVYYTGLLPTIDTIKKNNLGDIYDKKYIFLQEYSKKSVNIGENSSSKELINNLAQFFNDAFSKVSENKYKLEDDYFLNASHKDKFDFIYEENTSNFDKLVMCIMEKSIISDNTFKLFFGEDEFARLKGLLSKFKGLEIEYEQVNGKEDETKPKPLKEELIEIERKIANTVIKVSNLNQAHCSYINKFRAMNGSSLIDTAIFGAVGSGVVKNTSNKGIELSVNSTFGKSKNLSEYISPTVSSLITLDISSAIKQIIQPILADIIKSKGYGIIHRHGATGQLRAHLFLRDSNLIMNLLKNMRTYLRMKEFRQSITKEHLSYVHDLTNMFLDEVRLYASELCVNAKILEGDEKHTGSLGYYIRLYADPDIGFRANPIFLNNWKNKKLETPISKRKVFKQTMKNLIGIR